MLLTAALIAASATTGGDMAGNADGDAGTPLMVHARSESSAGDKDSNGVLYVREGERVSLRIGSVGDGARVRWYSLEPRPGPFDNTDDCGTPPRDGCRAPLPYGLIERRALRGRTHVELPEDDAAWAAPGSHRVIAAPGPLAPAGMRAWDDLIDASMEIVVRRSDSYLGYLTELFGVPFVHWPVRVAGGHQTDLRLGADCVALVIYGRRRMGERVPYLGPSGLPRYAQVLGEPMSLQRHAAGEGPAVRPGDVLDFGFQTAVLSRDLPPVGRLDENDRIIQTSRDRAGEVRLGAMPYWNAPVRVLRWPSEGP